MRDGMSDIVQLALEAVERTPEHDLRRLLQRLAVTDPFTIRNGVDGMDALDHYKNAGSTAHIKGNA
jgi:hypothetical protein